MNRLMPRPGLSLALLLCWLVLNASLDPGQIVLGGLLALLVPLAIGYRYQPGAGIRITNWRRALQLLLLFMGDIVMANLTVARQILWQGSTLHPAIVEIPLELNDHCLICVLASMITLTPGTVTIGIDTTRRTLSVHALHCTDPVALVAGIKTRYERALMEVFAC